MQPSSNRCRRNRKQQTSFPSNKLVFVGFYTSHCSYILRQNKRLTITIWAHSNSTCIQAGSGNLYGWQTRVKVWPLFVLQWLLSSGRTSCLARQLDYRFIQKMIPSILTISPYSPSEQKVLAHSHRGLFFMCLAVVQPGWRETNPDWGRRMCWLFCSWTMNGWWNWDAFKAMFPSPEFECACSGDRRTSARQQKAFPCNVNLRPSWAGFKNYRKSPGDGTCHVWNFQWERDRPMRFWRKKKTRQTDGLLNAMRCGVLPHAISRDFLLPLSVPTPCVCEWEKGA